MDIIIDSLTPCLENAKTGEIVDTYYTKANFKELSDLQNKGWLFNWTDPQLGNCEIFKLLVKNDSRIQGLVAIQDFTRDKAIYVKIAESAPHNLGKDKEFKGVGGHLFAIAAKTSMNFGYSGYIFMDAKNLDLVEHYHKNLGAMLLGMPHQYRMTIDEITAEKLLEKYTLKEETT